MKRAGVVVRPLLSLVCCTAAVVAVLASCTYAQAKATNFNVTEYIAKGYSATGPIRVLSVDAKALTLTLYSQPKNIVVNLKGRSLNIRDLNKTKLALTDLRKGTPVYVLKKAKEVLIIVLTAKEVRNDQ
jgi:hypothetical protein